jgi:hypothetical protein
MPPYALISLLLSIPLGALGWIATNLIARPILHAYEIREKAWEEMLMMADTSAFDGDQIEPARTALRRLAARASALDAAWPSPLRWLLKRLQLDLREASAGLLGLSNTFVFSADAAAYRHRACLALGLPPTLPANRPVLPTGNEGERIGNAAGLSLPVDRLSRAAGDQA